MTTRTLTTSTTENLAPTRIARCEMTDIEIVVEEIDKAVTALAKARMYMRAVPNREPSQEAMYRDIDLAMKALAGRLTPQS